MVCDMWRATVLSAVTSRQLANVPILHFPRYYLSWIETSDGTYLKELPHVEKFVPLIVPEGSSPPVSR
jgi:hypothetical protein